MNDSIFLFFLKWKSSNACGQNWVEKSMSKYDNDKLKIHWSSEEDRATLLKMVIEEYKKTFI